MTTPRDRSEPTIALLIPESTGRFFADPYLASVVQGAAMHLSGTDYTLTLLMATEADAVKTRRYLQGGNAVGVLVISHHADDEAHVALPADLPVVFGGRPMTAGFTPTAYVDIDNAGAARAVTEKLVAAGRRRIATIAGPADMSAGVDRLAGFEAALADAGLEPESVLHGDFAPASGARAMRHILDARRGVDGVFVASAQMASGALGVLHERGVRVPADLGLVTFDDDYAAQTAIPPLTTVAQPTQAVGRRMAELLLRLIAGEQVPASTIMPTELVDRGSQG